MLLVQARAIRTYHPTHTLQHLWDSAPSAPLAQENDSVHPLLHTYQANTGRDNAITPAPQGLPTSCEAYRHVANHTLSCYLLWWDSVHISGNIFVRPLFKRKDRNANMSWHAHTFSAYVHLLFLVRWTGDKSLIKWIVFQYKPWHLLYICMTICWPRNANMVQFCVSCVYALNKQLLYPCVVIHTAYI